MQPAFSALGDDWSWLGLAAAQLATRVEPPGFSTPVLDKPKFLSLVSNGVKERITADAKPGRSRFLTFVLLLFLSDSAGLEGALHLSGCRGQAGAEVWWDSGTLRAEV